jgi:6-phosphofructokinase 1
MRVGILTGGGDCPGLNAVIRAIVRRTIGKYGGEVLGFRFGWAGVMEGNTLPLGIDEVSGILPRGGTILGTSRTNPFRSEGGPEAIERQFKKAGLDGLVAVGGEDTLGVGYRLFQEHDLPIVGVPKTIDNDISGTDFTFGFDTAVAIATDAIDRLHTTAESHNRVVVVEVMGRHTGWIAVKAGIAGGADLILIPEIPVTLEEVCDTIRKRHARGKRFSIIVVAEGAEFPSAETKEAADASVVVSHSGTDAFGHVRLGGIGNKLAEVIEEDTGYETRVSVLGYIQRGGTPTAFDRVLGTRFGVVAADLVHGRDFGKMASIHGDRVIPVEMSHATEAIKRVDNELYEVARTFFG